MRERTAYRTVTGHLAWRLVAGEWLGRVTLTPDTLSIPGVLHKAATERVA